VTRQAIRIELVGGPECGRTLNHFTPGVTPLPAYHHGGFTYTYSAAGRRTAYGTEQYHVCPPRPATPHPTTMHGDDQ
jgi:hypothetical protein